MELWQDLTALILVAAATTYAVWNLRRRIRRKRCSGCSACGRSLVQLAPQKPPENRGDA